MISRSHPRRTSRRRPTEAHALRVSTVSALLLFGGLALVHAQGGEAEIPPELSGGAALSVFATDEAGRGVPGVAVVLRREDSARAVLGLATGDDGRLTIEGLAAGEWQIDLVREGFMMVTAYLRLEAGREPDVAFSSRQRTGSYWAPLNVAFLRPEDPTSAALRTGRGSVKAARKETARRERQDRKAAARRERRAQRPDTARVVEAAVLAATEPEPEPEPGPEPGTASEAVAETPTVAPDRTRPPVERSAVDEPAAASPPPVMATAPAAPAAPRSEAPAPAGANEADHPVAPEATPTPRLLPNAELRPAGACVECQAGEWSVAASSRAAAGAACPSSSEDDLAAIGRLIIDGLDGGLQEYAGALRAEDQNDVRRLLADSDRSELDRLAGALAEPANSCVLLGVVLPAGARYIGFRYEAGERTMTADCLLGQECQVGEAAWRAPPTVVESEASTVVLAVFENRSRKRERTARMTVYFRPARGWLPPSR